MHIKQKGFIMAENILTKEEASKQLYKIIEEFGNWTNLQVISVKNYIQSGQYKDKNFMQFITEMDKIDNYFDSVDLFFCFINGKVYNPKTIIEAEGSMPKDIIGLEFSMSLKKCMFWWSMLGRALKDKKNTGLETSLDKCLRNVFGFICNKKYDKDEIHKIEGGVKVLKTDFEKAGLEINELLDSMYSMAESQIRTDDVKVSGPNLAMILEWDPFAWYSQTPRVSISNLYPRPMKKVYEEAFKKSR